MSRDNQSALNLFLSTWSANTRYFDSLAMMASLSRLFSESDTPYLDYRLAENLFCKHFQADNDARACTAYDAHFPTLGVGIKTFALHGGVSTEKIAEFNKIKPQLDALRGKDLAVALGRCRNERMQVSNNAYSLTSVLYHIVGWDENSLIIFNSPYDFVNIDGICDVIDKGVSLRFNDGLNEYIFNRSKSVLMKRFVVPEYRVERPVEILADPLDVLESALLHAGSQAAIAPKRVDVQPQQRPRRVAAQKGNGQKARRARHYARPRALRIR